MKNIPGDPDYKYQVATYGHPSQFGFKDICHIWKAENWNPENLIRLYKRAGAKYFVALANHHCNFDCWNSNYQDERGLPNSSEDIRFSTKGNVLYAVLLGWPEKQAVIKSLPSGEKLWFGEIANVQLLGANQPLNFSRDERGLTVSMPREKTGDHAFVLKIFGKS